MTAQDRNEECSSTTACHLNHPARKAERNRCDPRASKERAHKVAAGHLSNVATAIQLGWHALICSGATNQPTPLHIIILVHHFVWIFFSISREDHRRCVNRTSDESGWCVWKPASACECSLSERMQKIRFHLNSVTFTGYRSWRMQCILYETCALTSKFIF